MHFDVVDLDAFYGKTRLGRIARNAIRARMHETLGPAAHPGD